MTTRRITVDSMIKSEPRRLPWRCRVFGHSWKPYAFRLSWSFYLPAVGVWTEHQKKQKGERCSRCPAYHLPTISIPFDLPGGYIDAIKLEPDD